MDYKNMMYEAEVYARAGNGVDSVARIISAWQGERELPPNAKERARRIMRLGNIPPDEIEMIIKNLERNRRVKCGGFCLTGVNGRVRVKYPPTGGNLKKT